MILVFLHQIPCYLVSPQEEIPVSPEVHFEHLEDWKARKKEGTGKCVSIGVLQSNTIGKWWILWGGKGPKKTTKEQTWVIITEDVKAAWHNLLSHFYVIRAGGGIVCDGKKVLFIKRSGYWDLPKGKQEAGENIKETALREVEEECGVLTQIRSLLTVTYHNYRQDELSILKETNWYNMEVKDQTNMRPQVEEGIEEARWIQDIDSVYAHCYPGIQHVLRLWESGTLQKNIL